jgi:ABC-type uncharacterized transport system substrate-binding protein
VNRKLCGLLLGTVILATLSSSRAQQPAKLPRIGYLSPTGNANAPGPDIEAFRQGLRELGYVEGKNIAVDYRYIEGKTDRMLNLVGELVQLKVDVFVLLSTPSIRAAKQTTKTIPVVMITTQDPVASGFIDSLARPGANITGVTTLQRELSGKRLELLKEAVPGIARAAALVGTVQVQSRNDLEWYKAPARALKIQLQVLEVVETNPDFDGLFRAAVKGRANALITIRGGEVNRHTKRIADLAIKHRLPSMHEGIEYVEDGGLMSYTGNRAENFRRAAYYVHRILKGTKPTDLPVEQPKKFELVINLKTAKQIGLTIPQSVLYRADKVIR